MMGGRTIEERILEMRFENDQFESGIRQSVNSLEMLRQALRMNDVADSLSNIETQFGNVDLTGIANDLDQIAYRTSAWGIVAENVISNITNAATQMVSNIGSKIKGLISTGGLTRAMNIEKAQFQLEGLGVAWEKISGDIDYAVKGTRYGLDEAAVAASQLVASNVQVGESMKTALRGISGVAAMTNREYGDISQIFTTVASNGKLMTMQLRQLSASGLNASAALAKQLGKTEQQVNDMVSKGEIDFATFAKAMDDAFGAHATKANETFTGAFANMKAAFARIGEKFWTPLMKGARDVLNEFTPLIDAVKNGLAPAFDLLNNVVQVATTKITSFLGGIDTAELTKKIENLTGRFKSFVQMISLAALNDKTDIGRTVNGIAAAFEMLKRAVSGVAGFIKQIAIALTPLGEGLLKVTAWFGDLLVKLNEATGSGSKFAGVFQSISDAFASLVQSISFGFKGFATVIDDFSKQLGGVKLANPIAKFVDKFKPAQKVVDSMKVAFAGLGHAAEMMKPVFESLGNGIQKVFDGIGAFINSGNLAKLIETFNAGFLTFMIAQMMDLGKAGKYIRDTFDQKFGVIIKTRMRDIKEAIQDMELMVGISTRFSNFVKLAIALALLAFALNALSKVDPKGLAQAVTALSVLLTELGVLFSVIMGMELSGGFGALSGLGVAMIGIGIALGLLSKSVIKLSSLNMDEIVAGLAGIGGAMFILVKGVSSLSSIEGKLAITAGQLILLAVALNLMALAVHQLGSMDIGELGKGLAGLGAILLELSLFVNRTTIQAGLAKTAAGILILGAAMNLFAASMRIIGAMDFDSMLVAIGGIGAVLLELAGFSQIVAGGGKLAAVGAGLLLVGSSMLIFTQVMKQMAGMDWESIGKGLAGIGGSLTAIAIATRIMPKNTPAIAAGIVLVSLALQQIATAMHGLGDLSWDEISKGLTAIGVVMLELGIAMAFMENAAVPAAALAALVGAFGLFIPELIALAQLPIPAIIAGLGGLAGALVLFGLTATVLAPMGPALTIVAGALALFGVAMAGIGIGLTSLVAALVAFGAAGAAAVAGFIAFLKELIALLPYVLEQVGLAIVALVKTLADSATEIAKAVVTIVKELLASIRKLFPDIIDTVLELVQTLLDKIIEKGPDLARAGLELLKQLLRGIRDNIGELITLAFEVVIAFAQALLQNVATLIGAGIQLIIDLVNGMAEAIPGYAKQLGEAAANLGIAIVEGVLKGLGGFAGRIKDKLLSGAKSALDAVKAKLGINSPSKVFRDQVGKNIVRGWVQGIDENRKLPAKALVETGEDALRAIQKSLKINSPSAVFRDEVGRWIAEGITEGIEADTTAEEAIKIKAQNIVDAFSKELNRVSMAADIAKLNFDIWEQMNPDASYHVYYGQQLRHLNELANFEARRLKIAEDELKQTIEEFGEASDEAMDAQKRMLEIKKSYLEVQQQIVNLDQEIESIDLNQVKQMREEATELAEAHIAVTKAQQELWEVMYPDRSAFQKAANSIEWYTDQLEEYETIIEIMTEELKETIEEFGDASLEVSKIRTKLFQTQKTYYDLLAARKKVYDDYRNGKDLTEDEEKALRESEQTIKDQELALEEYERILRDLAETNEKYGFGWSLDEMEAIARKRSGYDKKALDDARKLYNDLQNRTKEGLDELERMMDDKLRKISELFAQYGLKMADNLGGAFKQNITSTVIPTVNAALDIAKGNVLGAAGNMLNAALQGTLGASAGTSMVSSVLGAITSSSSIGSGSSSNPNKIDTSNYKPNISSSSSGKSTSSIVVNNNVTQNNTSPKALSNSSIFRATTGLMSVMVNTANTIAGNLLKGGTVKA